MKMPIRILGMLALLALARCGHDDLPVNDGLPCQMGFLGSLPLRPSASHLALDAVVNGAPTQLWLDTGAFSSVLTWDAVKRFGLRPEGVAGMAGIGGTQPLATYRAKRFSVGKVEGKAFLLGIGNLRLPPGIEGWVGMDFFSTTDLDVDLPGHRLNLYRPVHDCSHPSVYLHGPLYAVPLVGARPGRAYAADSTLSQPRIEVTIGGVALIAALDTGAPQNVLFGSGAAKLGLAVDHLAADPRVMTAGIGPQAYTAPLHTMPPIQIGDLQLRRVRASVIDDRLPDIDLLLGLDFYRRVHVWISHSSGQLVMQFPPAPSPLGEAPVAQPPSGPVR
jgi:clan AA aspartic protease (TIGR02281 family)